jgi:two-component system sensor histidine kinase RegB
MPGTLLPVEPLRGCTLELKPLWLIRFRWAVIIGETLILLAAWMLKSRQISALPIILILLTQLAMNLALLGFSHAHLVKTQGFFGMVITADVVLLTVILIYSGGAMNPYTIFYLVEVTAVAVLLEARWVWFCVLLCAGCYGSLFLMPQAHTIPGMPGMTDPEFRMHLYGMLISFVAAAICVAYFITRIQRDRVAMRRQLVIAQQRTAHMQRFAALTAVAAGAAHELATPLGTIAIAASELRQHFSLSLLPQDLVEDIKLIESQVQRCRSILDDLDPAGPGHQGFGRLTSQQILEQLARRLPKSVAQRLKSSCDTADRQFLLPESRLLQSLSAMAQNAIEASPAGAPVDISATCDGTTLRFSVRDYGTGLSAELRERIGEPFFSAKAAGRGLGLFLARQMMEECGGQLRIENNPDIGATFCLEFPLDKIQ